MHKEKLGSVWVDTGTLLVADPCQFIHDPDERPHISYTQLVELWDEQGTPYDVPAIGHEGRELIPGYKGIRPAQSIKIPSRGGGVGGIAVNVGCDGWYPVFLERNAKGEPVRIIIELGGHVDP